MLRKTLANIFRCKFKMIDNNYLSICFMDWKDHIVTDKDILDGKPIIKGTRISIEHIINLLASGWSETQILENYPRISKNTLQAIFLYIQECMQDGLLYTQSVKTV